MSQSKGIAEWMVDRGIDLAELVAGSGLEKKTVEAVVKGQYTPSPQQRQRLAAVLRVGVDEVVWGHAVPVVHVYGHGPQFGRSP